MKRPSEFPGCERLRPSAGFQVVVGQGNELTLASAY